jgi:hypothetical protein
MKLNTLEQIVKLADNKKATPNDMLFARWNYIAATNGYILIEWAVDLQADGKINIQKVKEYIAVQKAKGVKEFYSEDLKPFIEPEIRPVDISAFVSKPTDSAKASACFDAEKLAFCQKMAGTKALRWELCDWQMQAHTSEFEFIVMLVNDGK